MQNIKEIKQEDLSKCYLNCIRSEYKNNKEFC